MKMWFIPILLTTFVASALEFDHIVIVGGEDLDEYSPAEVKAEKGDTVTFQFASGKHDIVQGAFEKPCEPLVGGFYSNIISANHTGKAGSHKVPSSYQSYVVNITDTLPKWFYCSRGNHCKNGMVGVINAPSSTEKTIDAYSKGAKKVGKASRPKESSSPATTGTNTTSSASSSSPTSFSVASFSSDKSLFPNLTMASTTTSAQSTIVVSSSTPASTTSQHGTNSTSSTAPKSTGAAASNMGGSAIGLVALFAGAIVFG